MPNDCRGSLKNNLKRRNKHIQTFSNRVWSRIVHARGLVQVIPSWGVDLRQHLSRQVHKDLKLAIQEKTWVKVSLSRELRDVSRESKQFQEETNISKQRIGYFDSDSRLHSPIDVLENVSIAQYLVWSALLRIRSLWKQREARRPHESPSVKAKPSDKV